MNVLIYDGSQADDPRAPQVQRALLAELRARGWQAETIILRERRIGNCAGDFFCWVRSPGECNTNDDNRVLAAKMMRADLLVYLTPVTFGGYASALKRMVDHQIQNVAPFFTTIGGEIHHQKRYARYPDLLTIGWQPAPNARAEAVFGRLAQRNGLNMHARTVVSGVVAADANEPEVAGRVRAWLDAIASGTSSAVPALPEAGLACRGAVNAPARVVEAGQSGRGADTPPAQAERVVLLVGSPRTKKSTSAALGGYLLEQMAARGAATETIQLYTAFGSAARAQAALAAVGAADLVVLAFPLYVDSLPAPVIAALERIASGRPGRSGQARFAAIANCGFPEAAHNATALAICAEFARQAGFAWAGGLALGGGEGLVHGASLAELGGRALHIRQALDLAAAALVDGQPIPPEAANLLGRAIIPNWLYVLFGRFGWQAQAKHFGAEKKMRRQPYAAAGRQAP